MDEKREMQLLEEYNTVKPVSVSLIHKNNVYLVETETERFILKKILKETMSPGKLLKEHRLLNYLKDSGIPVACPLKTKSNSTYIESDDAYYVLSPELNNSPVDFFSLQSESMYRRIGCDIANLHKALADYPYQIHNFSIDPFNNVYNTILPDLAVMKNDYSRITEVLSALQDEMKDALNDLPLQLIHGDCHTGNVCVSGNQVSGFIDCDHLPLGPRLFDICEYLIHIIKWDVSDRYKTDMFIQLFPAFMKGYHEIFPLSNRELHSVWHMLLYMQAVFFHWKIKNNWSDTFTNAYKDLDAFWWVYDNRSRIEEHIYETDILSKS